MRSIHRWGAALGSMALLACACQRTSERGTSSNAARNADAVAGMAASVAARPLKLRVRSVAPFELTKSSLPTIDGGERFESQPFVAGKPSAERDPLGVVRCSVEAGGVPANASWGPIEVTSTQASTSIFGEGSIAWASLRLAKNAEGITQIDCSREVAVGNAAPIRLSEIRQAFAGDSSGAYVVFENGS